MRKNTLSPFAGYPGDRRSTSGFTLLEVMIALAIVSIALVSLLALGNRSIGVHDRLQKITQATLLAQHKMAEIEASSSNSQQNFNEEEGVFSEPFGIYRWSLEYSGTPLPSVRMVTVTVRWGDEENNELVSIDSFVF